jgi:hypothetical protein
MRPTQPPIQWLLGALFPGLKQLLGHEYNHLLPPRAEVEFIQSCTYIYACVAMKWCLNGRDHLLFTFTAFHSFVFSNIAAKLC